MNVIRDFDYTVAGKREDEFFFRFFLNLKFLKWRSQYREEEFLTLYFIRTSLNVSIHKTYKCVQINSISFLVIVTDLFLMASCYRLSTYLQNKTSIVGFVTI